MRAKQAVATETVMNASLERDGSRGKSLEWMEAIDQC